MDRFSDSFDVFSDCSGDHMDDANGQPFSDTDALVINGVREQRYKSWETIHRNAIALMLANRKSANA